MHNWGAVMAAVQPGGDLWGAGREYRAYQVIPAHLGAASAPNQCRATAHILPVRRHPLTAALLADRPGWICLPLASLPPVAAVPSFLLQAAGMMVLGGTQRRCRQLAPRTTQVTCRAGTLL